MIKKIISINNYNKFILFNHSQTNWDCSLKKATVIYAPNGSGKTSVLEAMVKYLEYIVSPNGYSLEEAKNNCDYYLQRIKELTALEDSEQNRKQIYDCKKYLKVWENNLQKANVGIVLECTSDTVLKEKYEQGNFIFSYYILLNYTLKKEFFQ